MIPYYVDYRWEKGKPVGLQKATQSDMKKYRIVSDPYHKWISVELYGPSFEKVIYDSRFLDFRKLSANDQIAWRKEPKNEYESWIFNEDDRLILREWCSEDNKEVQIFSPHGQLICRYEMAEGPEGDVLLFDSNDHVVFKRKRGENSFK